MMMYYGGYGGYGYGGRWFGGFLGFLESLIMPFIGLLVIVGLCALIGFFIAWFLRKLNSSATLTTPRKVKTIKSSTHETIDAP